MKLASPWMSWPAAANRSKRWSYAAPRGASESDQRLIRRFLQDRAPLAGAARSEQRGDRLRPVHEAVGQVAEQLGQAGHEVVVGAGRAPEHRDATPRHRLGGAAEVHDLGQRDGGLEPPLGGARYAGASGARP